MRKPYKYLLKLWLLTVLLGPAFLAVYQFKMEALGVMFVLWGFGLFFSLPALLLGALVVWLTQQRRTSARSFRLILAVVGSAAIAITLSLVQGEFALETIPYVLAVVVATWLLGRNAKEEDAPPVEGGV